MTYLKRKGQIGVKVGLWFTNTSAAGNVVGIKQTAGFNRHDLSEKQKKLIEETVKQIMKDLTVEEAKWQIHKILCPGHPRLRTPRGDYYTLTDPRNVSACMLTVGFCLVPDCG